MATASQRLEQNAAKNNLAGTGVTTHESFFRQFKQEVRELTGNSAECDANMADLTAVFNAGLQRVIDNGNRLEGVKAHKVECITDAAQAYVKESDSSLEALQEKYDSLVAG